MPRAVSKPLAVSFRRVRVDDVNSAELPCRASRKMMGGVAPHGPSRGDSLLLSHTPIAMTRRTGRLSPWCQPLLWGMALACCAGCASFDRAMLGVDDDANQFATFEESYDPPSAMDRFLVASGLKEQPSVSPYLRATVPPDAREAFDAAQSLYDEGKYEAAERSAHGLAKKYRNSTIEEDSLFLKAESQFKRKQYASAQDTYMELFERFPSTRYMDASTKHLFEIGRYWLQFPEIVQSAEIQPANFEVPSQSPLPKPKKQPFDITRSVPFLPNFADPTRPAFDTEGRALEALKAIWLNDPTGDLADDALMMTASHYLRQGNYIEADHYYEILREEYPKSRHLEDAFVIGAHAKLMSYQGAVYDRTALNESERLKESTLRLFPEGAERDRITEELQKIQELDADRAWARVEYYQRKSNRRLPAVAMSCYTLITEHPDSKYVPRAWEVLDSLPPSAKESLPPLPPRKSTTAPIRVSGEEPQLETVPNSYE